MPRAPHSCAGGNKTTADGDAVRLNVLDDRIGETGDVERLQLVQSIA